MNEKLEKALYEKYPELFRQASLPESQSCMFWGIACGDGWYEIMDTLCSLIQHRVNRKKIENHDYQQVEFAQIKEKFGELRIYACGCDEYVGALIDFACLTSLKTCESCGSPGKMSNKKGWMQTLCEECKIIHEVSEDEEEDDEYV